MHEAFLLQEIEDEVDYEGPLTSTELASLTVPSDLGFILEGAHSSESEIC